MKRKFYVANRREIPPGKAKKVQADRHSIALFNHQGSYYAIQNSCPHQNGDLSEGYIRNEQLYCPLHHWAFNIKDGTYAFNPGLSLKIFPVKIQDEKIYIIIE